MSAAPKAEPIVKHLTNAVVEGIVCPPDKANVIVWDTEVKGFGVRVNTAGTVRTYLLLYRVRTTRQERQVKIGRHNQPWKVKQARARALDLKGLMDTGVDPVLVQQEQREQEAAEQERERYETITLREVMDDYLKNHRRRKLGTPLRPATQQDILRHVNGNLADWADEPVASITRDACIERFDAIAETSRAQAAQAFAYLRCLLTHAKEMFETQDGDFPLLEVNPVQRMFRKRSPPDEAPRDTRIPIDKVREVWRMLCSRRHTVDHDEQTRNDWVQFIMLTGCRRTESGSLEWANVDFDAGTVHFPITKNHVPLTLPMSTQMRELLDRRLAERPHDKPSPFVFPSKQTDIRVWGKGRWFKALASNGSGIEAYSEKRFGTLTGWGHGELRDVAEFVEQELAPVHAARAGKTPAASTADDADVVLDPKTVTELRDALNAIKSDDRDVWVKVGMALKSLSNGRGMWLTWSQSSDKFDAQDAARVWQSLDPHTLDHKWVFAEAQRRGWVKQAVIEATRSDAEDRALELVRLHPRDLITGREFGHELYGIEYSAREEGKLKHRAKEAGIVKLKTAEGKAARLRVAGRQETVWILRNPEHWQKASDEAVRHELCRPIQG